MVSRVARVRIVVAVWFETTVCPSSVSMEITVPSMGA